MPGDFFPRFSLIAAFATCSNETITGSTVVKLFGAGSVDLKLAPHSDVILEIAGEEFGPFRTDEAGKVKIPIVVPPGVKTGNVGEKTIDLNLPTVNRIIAIQEKKGLSKDPGTETTILIYAIDGTSGKPLLNANLKIKPEKGTISRIAEVASGVYRAYYKPPEQLGYGQDDVSVSSISPHHLLEAEKK